MILNNLFASLLQLKLFFRLHNNVLTSACCERSYSFKVVLCSFCNVLYAIAIVVFSLFCKCLVSIPGHISVNYSFFFFF